MSGVFSEAWEREAFDALVAHPYGMAAMALVMEKLCLRDRTSGSEGKFMLTAILLADEIEKARARARGRGRT